jgi:hypothetical protein
VDYHRDRPLEVPISTDSAEVSWTQVHLVVTEALISSHFESNNTLVNWFSGLLAFIALQDHLDTTDPPCPGVCRGVNDIPPSPALASLSRRGTPSCRGGLALNTPTFLKERYTDTAVSAWDMLFSDIDVMTSVCLLGVLGTEHRLADSIVPTPLKAQVKETGN